MNEIIAIQLGWIFGCLLYLLISFIGDKIQYHRYKRKMKNYKPPEPPEPAKCLGKPLIFKK